MKPEEYKTYEIIIDSYKTVIKKKIKEGQDTIALEKRLLDKQIEFYRKKLIARKKY